MFRPAIILLFIMWCSLGLHAQVRQVDSLLAALAEHPQPDTHRVSLLAALGFAYYTINSDKTADYAREVLHLSEQLQYDQGLARGHQLQGIAASVQGDYPAALESFLIALSIQRKLGDERAVAKNLNNLAGIYFYQRDWEKALHYNQQSLVANRALNDSAGMANAHLARGMMYARMERPAEAKAAFEQALDIFTWRGDSLHMADAYVEMGDVFIGAGRQVTAMRYYQQALAINQRTGDRSGTASALIRLARLYLDARQLSSAERAIDEAMELAQATGSRDQRMHIYLLMTRLDSLRGQYRSALAHFDRYVIIKDSLFNQDRSEQMAKIEIQYQNEQARQEAQLLKKEKELSDMRLAAHEATIRTQRLIFGGTTFLLLLLGVGIAILYRLYLSRHNMHDRLAQQTTEMQRQKEELEALNRTKDQWFSILGHDFRYPLHFLQHALSLINEGNLSEREQAMLTRELEQRARNAGNLLDNLLYWAQGQLEEISLTPTYLILHEQVAQSLHYLEHAAEKKGVVLSNKVPTKLRAWADQDTLQLVLRNLLENAIKFSFRGDVVRIEGEERGDEVVLAVQDYGIGMSEEVQRRLFQRHQPYATAGTNRERGTGIGLILSRDIVERNHGHIRVESEPGKGSTFYVHLPRQERQVAAPSPPGMPQPRFGQSHPGEEHRHTQ